MNPYNSTCLSWAHVYRPSVVEHCLCHVHNQRTSTCSHEHVPQSFPVAQYHGPCRSVSLLGSLGPENNISVDPLYHSRHTSSPCMHFHHVGVNSLHSEHPLCQWEGLQCSARPMSRHEGFSGSIHLPGTTDSLDLAFPGLGQSFLPISTYTSSSKLGQIPPHTHPPMALPEYPDTGVYQSPERAALSPTSVTKESESVSANSVSSSLNDPIELAETVERDVYATSHNDTTSTSDTIINPCSLTIPPASPFPSMVSDPLDHSTTTQELYSPANEQPPTQNVEMASHLLSNESNDKHDNNQYLSCLDEFEGLEQVEAFNDLIAESPVLSCVTIESSNASTEIHLGTLLSTTVHLNTTSSLDEIIGESSAPSPEPTPSGKSTNMPETLPLPSLHIPETSITSVAVEVSKSSELGKEPPVRALSCPFPECTSKILFTRICDLNKHYRQHFKRFFCRVEGCPSSEQAALSGRTHGFPVGFALKKDRLRHETSHNPSIRCEICGKVFSRVDNMQNHIQRIHRRYLQG